MADAVSLCVLLALDSEKPAGLDDGALYSHLLGCRIPTHGSRNDDLQLLWSVKVGSAQLETACARRLMQLPASNRPRDCNRNRPARPNEATPSLTSQNLNHCHHLMRRVDPVVSTSNPRERSISARRMTFSGTGASRVNSFQEIKHRSAPCSACSAIRARARRSCCLIASAVSARIRH